MSQIRAHIVLLPGDGIGGEVVEEARACLDAVASLFGHAFSFEEHAFGGGAIDRCGDPLPGETLSACRRADAVLLGAVGGPKWDDPRARTRPEAGLLRLRRELGLYANLRPIRVYHELHAASPLKPDRLIGVDILVVRELTGGLYFGPRHTERSDDGGTRAVDTLEYTDVEIRRVVRLAFQLAAQRRGLVTSVDKANVLDSSRLWRQIAEEVAAEPGNRGVTLQHQLVDSAAMRLIAQPRGFDVIVTENLFGDILTDEAAVLAGSIGLLPSASLGQGTFGVYEPIHGSAPDIAGAGIANPIGAILSAAMLLRHSLGLELEAAALENGVAAAIATGARTADMGAPYAISTQKMGEAVRARLEPSVAGDLARWLEEGSWRR